MNVVRIIVVFAIAYGSLFPFDFDFPELSSHAIDSFLGSWRAPSSRGDLLGNVILFVPFGLVGTISARTSKQAVWQAATVVLAAAGFAAILQFLQVYLPSRTAALSDVLWNLLGTGLGCAGGMLLAGQAARWAERRQDLQLVPLLLLGCWAALRWAPFVPSIDYEAMKDSLKPLLLMPEITLSGVAINAAAWLAAAYMIQRLTTRRLPGPGLALVMVLTFAVEVLVVDNAVTASNVVGAGVAWLLAFFVLAPSQRALLALAGILLLAITIRGLEPFVLRTILVEFNWLPFADFLDGGMYHNTLVIIEKTFLYGGLIYVLRCAGSLWLVCTVFAAIILALIEMAQMIFANHTPGITDPILAVLLGFAMMALDGQSRKSALKPAPPA